MRIEIRDDGPGFAPDVLLRAGEPYVTTRSREGGTPSEIGGGGLGLGLFIAKTLIERTGAQLVLSNAAPPATGAVVRIVWPRAAFERDVEQAGGASRRPNPCRRRKPFLYKALKQAAAHERASRDARGDPIMADVQVLPEAAAEPPATTAF